MEVTRNRYITHTLLNIAAICAVLWASTEMSYRSPSQEPAPKKVTDFLPCACRCSGELLEGLYLTGTIASTTPRGVIIQQPGGGLFPYEGTVLPIAGAVQPKSYKPPAVGSNVEYRDNEDYSGLGYPGGRTLVVRQSSPAGTIQQRVRVLLIEQLGVDEEEVVLDAKLVDDLGADETDMPEMINAIEVEFGVEITMDEVELLGPCVKHVTEYVIRRLLPH